jgi:serine/threonine protein phosphatase PrpC
MDMFEKVLGLLRRVFGGGPSKEEQAREGDVPAREAPDVEAVAIESGAAATTRRLPPLEKVYAVPKYLNYGQATDVGLQRSENEDALLALSAVCESAHILPPFALFIVADGMGGYAGGERASALAVETFAYHITNAACLPILARQRPADDQEAMLEMLSEAMRQTNLEVGEGAPGSGTTCTAALILGSTLYVVHIGDSRAYLIHDGKVNQITRDHSVAGRLVEIGQISPEEVRQHPERHKLYKALGKGETQPPDLITGSLPSGAWLLLCTDGLWGPIVEAAMLKIITDAPNAQAACDQLIAAANENGGEDNITAVLVEIPAWVPHGG